MRDRPKNYGLVICLFVFLFVIIGGGLHLAPGGAFLAAVTGTPLVIHAFRTKLRTTTANAILRGMRSNMPAAPPLTLTDEGATARSDASLASADLPLVSESESSLAIRRHL